MVLLCQSPHSVLITPLGSITPTPSLSTSNRSRPRYHRLVGFPQTLSHATLQLFYPIDNTPIGGGTSSNIVFPANTRTDWTFPFDVQYKTSRDPGGKVLSDLLNKCGPNKQNLRINYKITASIICIFAWARVLIC